MTRAMGGRYLARPWLALLLVAGLLGGAHAAASPAVAAGTTGACPTMSGVTVVVDYGSLGGVEVRCAPGSPSTGLDALKQAGFTYTLVEAGPFVCRIRGLGNDACVNYPSGSDPYWAYWHASRGGSWSYSSSGASSSHPAQGSVEGWAFESSGSKNPPGIAPPAAPKPTPKPTARPTATPRPTAAPTARPTAAPSTEPAKSAKPSTSSSESVPAGSASASPVDEPSSSTASLPSDDPGVSADPSAEAVVTAPSPADGAPSDAPGDGNDTPADDPGAPPIGTLLGAGLVAALLGGGWMLSRRRGAPGA